MNLSVEDFLQLRDCSSVIRSPEPEPVGLTLEVEEAAATTNVEVVVAS